MTYIFRILPFSIFLLLGCYVFCNGQEQQKYLLLYPLETSSQTIQIYDGSRFTEAGTNITVALGVLNNPLVDGSYADIALLALNSSNEPVNLVVDSVRTRAGELKTLAPESLRDRIMTGDIFMEKDSIDSLAPKAQAHGCAPGKSKNTLKPEEMNKLQQGIVDFQSSYKLKLNDYLQNHLLTPTPIAPGTIGGGVARIMLPNVEQDGPMLIKLTAGNEKITLRLQLQHLE